MDLSNVRLAIVRVEPTEKSPPVMLIEIATGESEISIKDVYQAGLSDDFIKKVESLVEEVMTMFPILN